MDDSLMRISRFGRRPLACLVGVVEKRAVRWMMAGWDMKLLLRLLLPFLLPVSTLLVDRPSGRGEPRQGADDCHAGKLVARDCCCGGSRSRHRTLLQLLNGEHRADEVPIVALMLGGVFFMEFV